MVKLVNSMEGNMKYISFEFGKEKFWIEVGADGFALRQITVDAENNAHISCLEDCLAEGKIEGYELDCTIKKITWHKFQAVWDKYTSTNRKKWDILKKRMEIGKLVQGKVLYHYPQGWILQVDSLLAVYAGDLELNIGQQVSGKISGYDEKNMWLILNEIK